MQSLLMKVLPPLKQNWSDQSDDSDDSDYDPSVDNDPNDKLVCSETVTSTHARTHAH